MSTDQYQQGGPVGPVPVVAGPWDTAAAWGAAAPLPEADNTSTERLWISPGVAPWAPGHRRKGWPRSTWLGLAAILLGVLAIAGFAVQRSNLLPAGVPVIGMDSGVAACKAISSGTKPTGSGEQVSQDKYREMRSVFADSRYPAIRDNGVKLIDTAWQIQAIPAGEEMGALVYIGAFTGAYAGLSGGCAEQGYTIPPLSAN